MRSINTWKLVIVVVSVIIFSTVATASVGLSFNVVEIVGFGEVTQDESDLQITGYETDATGDVVDAINLTVDNTNTKGIEAEYAVTLLDGGSEVASSTVTETVAGSSTETVQLSFSGVSQYEYTEVDIRIEERQFVTGQTVTGTVSYNPPAEGVKVELIDGSGTVLDSDTTGADGSYSLSGSANTLEIRVKGSTFSTSKSSINLIDDVGIIKSDVPTELMNGTGTSTDPYEVETASDLQSAKYDLDAYYEVQNDIDASPTSSWNSGNGFEPVGDFSNRFTGSFDGQNYTINSLHIDRGSNYIGLFTFVNSGSTVENIGMTNVDITGDVGVGGLVGYNGGDVLSSYATGSVTGSDSVGGLVGNNAGSVSSSYATGSVSGSSRVGGLVGYNGGDVLSSYATGSISGSSEVGGLVGGNAGSVSSSYWDTESTGQSSSAGSATGLTTSEMQGGSASTNMSGLDFSRTWSTVTDDYPVLDSLNRTKQLNNR